MKKPPDRLDQEALSDYVLGRVWFGHHAFQLGESPSLRRRVFLFSEAQHPGHL